MSILHWLASIGDCLASLLFVVAGVIGVRRWQTPSGWLLIGAGVFAGFGAAGEIAWPMIRELLGRAPMSGYVFLHSRIIGVCQLLQSAGWILAALGTIQAVKGLLNAIKQSEDLRRT